MKPCRMWRRAGCFWSGNTVFDFQAHMGCAGEEVGQQDSEPRKTHVDSRRPERHGSPENTRRQQATRAGGGGVTGDPSGPVRGQMRFWDTQLPVRLT